MTIQAPPQSLLQLLSQEVEQAAALLEALRAEHLALSERAAADIETAINAKQERLDRFERCEHHRKEWLRRAGVAEERSAIRKFLAAQTEHADQLVSLWDQLLTLAAECHDQNGANGALVEIHRRHVQRSLDLLRGTQDTPTYGPGGETRDRDDRHSLAKA